MSSINWPADFARTDPVDRTKTWKFEVKLSKAFDDLEQTFEHIGVDNYRYGFDAESRQTDGRPYARAVPEDPGFVVRWTDEGDDYAVACDQYTVLRDNVRAVGLYLDEKRKMQSRPVVTGESEFANARLPAADEAVVASPPPHKVLDVSPDAPDAVVKGAARSLLADHHPDQGGDPEQFRRVKRARDELLDGGGPE